MPGPVRIVEKVALLEHSGAPRYVLLELRQRGVAGPHVEEAALQRSHVARVARLYEFPFLPAGSLNEPDDDSERGPLHTV